MNYEDIRKYQRMERNAADLAAIDDNFYQDLGSLVIDQKRRYSTNRSADDLRTLENISKVARDIFERREQKILLKSLRDVRTGEKDGVSLPEQESEFLNNLIEILGTNRRRFEQLMVGEHMPQQPTASVKPAEVAKGNEIKTIQNINDIPQLNNGEKMQVERAEKESGAVSVKIIKRVSKFVSSDLKEYGPYERDDLVELPKKEAELLSKREFVEII